MTNLLQKHQFVIILLLTLLLAGCRQITTFDHELQIQDATTGDPVENAMVRAEMGLRDAVEGVSDAQGVVKLAVDELYRDAWTKVIVEADEYGQQSFLAKLTADSPTATLQLQLPAAETPAEQPADEETTLTEEVPAEQSPEGETIPTAETTPSEETQTDDLAAENGITETETAESVIEDNTSIELPPLGELSTLPPAQRIGYYSAKPELTIDPTKTYQATIITSKGNIVLSLDASASPEHVNNFIFLSKQGFYDGLIFHRVEPGFVIQGGDPQGSGGGGPGYTIPGEFSLTHGAGALAMARLPDDVNPERESSGSQFYITLAPTPPLDGQYSVFGQVEAGMDVVQSIAIGDIIERIIITES